MAEISMTKNQSQITSILGRGYTAELRRTHFFKYFTKHNAYTTTLTPENGYLGHIAVLSIITGKSVIHLIQLPLGMWLGHLTELGMYKVKNNKVIQHWI